MTAALPAGLFVTGAVLDDRRQMLIALPADRPGVLVRPPFPLAALQASCTAKSLWTAWRWTVPTCWPGPAADLPSRPRARSERPDWRHRHWQLGQARAALEAIVKLAPAQSELTEPVELLCDHWRSSWQASWRWAAGRTPARPVSFVPRPIPWSCVRPRPI